MKILHPWLEVEEVERKEICSEISRTDQLMAFEESKTFQEIRKFCAAVGGQFAVARDNASFWEISEIFKETCSKFGLGFFYSGYTDREPGCTFFNIRYLLSKFPFFGRKYPGWT